MSKEVYTKINGKVYKHSLKASKLIGAIMSRMKMGRDYLRENKLGKLEDNQKELANCVESLFTELCECVGECEMSFNYEVLDFVRKDKDQS